MTIGNRIMYCRKKLNITQDALAQKLGVTNQAVSKWELDQACPDIQLLPALADVFGIAIDELFGRAPQKAEAATGRILPWEDDGTLRIVVYKGYTLLKHVPAEEKFTFCYEGPALNIFSSLSVTCGDVGGNVDAGSHVSCGNVEGDVDAGSSVRCGNVDGSVDAGSDVKCGDVHGDVDAGGNIQCGSIGGDADAGGSIVIR